MWIALFNLRQDAGYVGHGTVGREMANDRQTPLRYPREGQMSSIGYHQGRQDGVAKNVRLMPHTAMNLRRLRRRKLDAQKSGWLDRNRFMLQEIGRFPPDNTSIDDAARKLPFSPIIPPSLSGIYARIGRYGRLFFTQ
jgi:hypothetical protein